MRARGLSESLDHLSSSRNDGPGAARRSGSSGAIKLIVDASTGAGAYAGGVRVGRVLPRADRSCGSGPGSSRVRGTWPHGDPRRAAPAMAVPDAGRGMAENPDRSIPLYGRLCQVDSRLARPRRQVASLRNSQVPKTLAGLLREVDRDPTGIFWG